MRAWLATGLTAVLLIAAGCSDGTDDAAPSDRLTAPRVGECRLLAPADVRRASDDTDTVACAEKHTAETFLVADLPASTGTAYDDRRHGRFAHRTCERAFQRFLGADESLRLRTRLSWAWFRPSEAGWKKGARWMRCDVVGGPSSDEALRALPPTAKGLLAKGESSAWMSCARGADFAKARSVACSQQHDWRAVTAVKIGAPRDSYPGDRISEVRARDNCSDWVGAWMNYPTDYEYAYTAFHEAEWQAGNRRAVCWARTAR